MPTIACRVIGPCWLFKWSHKHETFEIVQKSWNPKKLLVQKRSWDFFYHFEFSNSFPHGYFLYTLLLLFLTFMISCNLGSLQELAHLLYHLKTNKIRLNQHFRLFLTEVAFLWFFISSWKDWFSISSQKDSSIQVPFIRACCFWAWGMKNGR